MTAQSLYVDVATQRLYAYENQRIWRDWSISTSRDGLGEQKNSYQTPRGHHCIRAKIGKGLPCYAVLKGRRYQGYEWTPSLGADQPHADWILSRILWLSGQEIGFNRLGAVDTMQRYVYIHGTPDVEFLGHPYSHGCIRMACDDIIALFDWVEVGADVYIMEVWDGSNPNFKNSI